MNKDNAKSISPNLSLREYAFILENTCANLFATDGNGKIIYANKDAVAALDCPLEELLRMDVYELRDQGYVSYSTTNEVLRTGKQAIGIFFNKSGREVVAVSTPVFGQDGSISMVVTCSRQLEMLKIFQQELQAQREQVKNYHGALEYLGHAGIDSDIIIKDPTMIEIFHTLRQIAKTDSTVMLYGESGVGKEVLANFIRRYSTRKDKIYIPINCSTIPPNLTESELFGYEKGTFTGANKDGKAGLFELANEGTLFLDEIGELPMAAQSKLLRVMESGDYRRIGGETTRNANVRIIGATNRDLKKMVENNEFRADLYYRLNVMPISIPPLRNRPLEIDAFADLFLAQFNRKHQKHRLLSNELYGAMQRYPWPGNIRELRNVLERYVITGDVRILAPDNWDEQIYGVISPSVSPHSISLPKATYTRSLSHMLELTEHYYIMQVVKQCDGNIVKAAKLLRISRSGLYKKLKKIDTLAE